MSRPEQTPEAKRRTRRTFWTVVAAIVAVYVVVPALRNGIGVLLLLVGFFLALLAGMSSTIMRHYGYLLPEDMHITQGEMWGMFGIGVFLALSGIAVVAL